MPLDVYFAYADAAVFLSPMPAMLDFLASFPLLDDFFFRRHTLSSAFRAPRGSTSIRDGSDMRRKAEHMAI